MKNGLEGFNEIVIYIEEHLEAEINYEDLGRIIGYSSYHLQRLFLMITNIPISEYIRNRILSNAAYDLLNENETVTDVAFKYRYSYPTSFSRAFKSFHNITPKKILRKTKVTLKPTHHLIFSYQ